MAEIYSVGNELERVFYEGREKLLTFNPSADLLNAIDDLEYALDEDRYSYMEERIVATWDDYHDLLFEQERENFGGWLIDPLLDLLR